MTRLFITSMKWLFNSETPLFGSKQTINNIMIIIERYIKYIAAIRIEVTQTMPIMRRSLRITDLSAKRATKFCALSLHIIFLTSMLSAVGYGDFNP